MLNKPNYYSNEYYGDRLGKEPDKRSRSFKLESEFINKYIKRGTLIDIGCATGEFLDALNWTGEKYGMEVSDYAINTAKKKGIRFDKDIFAGEELFDLIIFRGTIQHIDTPMYYIKQSFKALKKGGYVVFLATPNADSICYKLFGTLNFLAPHLNFYIPSETTLPQILTNFGFKVIETRFPYLGSPYASPIKDHIKFILRCLGIKTNFAFWKSSIEIIAQKPL